MTSYLSAGVAIKETDFSFYVKQISTASCAMVGVAERGPINRPTLVTSWERFTRVFGSFIRSGYLAYAARLFFDNGGSILYVNRIAHLADPSDRHSLTALKSLVDLLDRSPTPQPALRIQATDEGAWGDQLAVAVEESRKGAKAQRREGALHHLFLCTPGNIYDQLAQRTFFLSGFAALREIFPSS